MKQRLCICTLIVACLLTFSIKKIEAAIQCNGCHGTSIPADNRPVDALFRNPSSGGFPGNHRTHMDAQAAPTACETCHPDSSSYNATHRDGLIKVSSRINNASLTTTYKNTTSAFLQATTPTLGSCASVNCHFEAATPTWGSDPALTTCSTCHGAPPSGAATTYLGGAAGSHAKHDQYYPGSSNCKKCHPDNATFAHATSAGNRDLKISFTAAPNNGSGSYTGPLNDYLPSQTNNFGVCNATYCHSPGNKSTSYNAPNQIATWGGTLGCAGCHLAAPATGSHGRHLSSTFNVPVACYICHAATVTSATTVSSTANHVNKKVDIAFSSTTTATFGKYSGIPAPMQKNPGSGYGKCENVYCHSSAQGAGGSWPPVYSSPKWGVSTTGKCPSCHANGSPHGGALINSGSHAKHINSFTDSNKCGVCHYGAGFATTGCTQCHTAGNSKMPVLHANHKVDVSFLNPYNSTTYNGTPEPGDGYGACGSISCHGNTSARWGSTACLDCHSVAQGKRAAITSQFGSGSHHVQGTITDAHCYQCHWEANSDGSINQAYHNSSVSGAAVRLVVYSTMQRPKNAAKYFIAYTANGTRAQIQKIGNHCLGCHSDQNNTATPFGDGKTPKQYAWDGTSVAARYSQSGATSWGKYTSAAYPNAAKKKIAKALSAHGNAGANQRGWNTTSGVDGTITNTSGAIAVQCYDCHNSHGSTVAGITSRYSSATGRNKGGILKNTQRGFGGYSATYRPQAAGSAANKDARNPGASLCLDCHFSSTPKQAPLATFKNYTTPWGYNSTFGATQGILGYWDSPYMSYGSNVGAKQRYPFKAQNLTKGGHFGASSSLSTQLPPGSQINGLCTPCHDPHGVSPTMGANQQHAVPLLKGTWLSSPYQEDTAPPNNADMYITGGWGLPFRIDQNTFVGGITNVTVPGLTRNDTTVSAGLCLGCHSKASLTNGSNHTWKSKDRVHEAVKGWKSANGVNQHSYTCSKCHSAHTSSVLPRLMVTNCLDSIHKGRTSLNISPMTSDWGSGDFGGGSGRIPGIYSGGGDDCGGYRACNELPFSVNCHEGNTGVGTDQTWNVVTPWAVATPPPAPTPTAQSDSISSGGNRYITLQWSAVSCPSGATPQYYVEVSNSSDFATISYNSGWIAATSWIQPLPLGTWYWRVTARDSTVTTAQSVPSTSDTFIISFLAPVAPTLTAQTNSTSSGGAISKTFNWSTVTPTDVDAVQYRVEVSTSAANFTTISYDSAWIASTSWTQSIPIGTWVWRVTTRDSVHTTAISAPSSAGSFSITLTPPSAPTLVAQPATSYTSGTDKSISFNWNPVTSPDGDSCQYLAEVSANSSFSPVSYASDWQAGTSWTQVLPTGSWYWRVKSRDSVHTTAVSNPSGFGGFGIAYAAPVAPTLVAQANYNSASNVDVTFQWNAVTPTDSDPMEYYVEVSSVADFASIAYQSSWQSPTSWTQSVAPGTWYWRVKTRDSVHTAAVSNPSANNNFSISTDPLPPIAPVLIVQANGNTACTTAYTHNLQWNAVTAPDGHAVEYYLQLDTASSFDSANLQQPGWQSAATWTTPTPITTGTWYWRVKARDAVDTAMESSYSVNGSFIDTYTWDCSCDNSCASSCPLVYSWNGTGYSYETDLQGPAISQIKKGARNVTLYQPSYITLDGLVPDANNQYRVKIWESLIEATLLDEAKLLAVDYPQGYQLASTGAENTYYYGYVDPFKIYTLKDPVPPITATDKLGNNVLANLQNVDNNPAPMTADDPDNYYTLDFGTIQHPENAKLVIDAWQIINSKIYLSTVTIQPYVEVVDADGLWVKVKSFGMPMGDLKTMIVDLSNKFLSSDHRIRVHLGIKKAQIWVIDKIRLDDSAPVSVSVQELAASSADLQVGGHAIKDMNTEQHRILVNEQSLPAHTGYYGFGNFTRLGEVGELLTQRDDKYVIMNYADMLDMTFPALAAPQAGMTRGFLLKADNYYKEFKEYKYLEPLPFHGMSDYPPPAPQAYPTDLEHNQYRQDYNTRIFTP